MNLIRPSIFSDSSNVTAVFTASSNNLGRKRFDYGINTLSEKLEVDRNYNHLLGDLNLEPNSVALANQVHGSNIQVVDEPGLYKETDGLITKTKGLALGIQVADCAAVLIADIKNEVIGAFHAGWRGAAAGIIPKGLEKIESIGGEKGHFKAYISPCISQEMFEVGEEVAIQFPESFVDRINYSKPHIDLKGFLVHQMTEFGLNDNQIEVSKGCTMKEKRFFSYRREREKAGRMLGLINLNHN